MDIFYRIALLFVLYEISLSSASQCVEPYKEHRDLFEVCRRKQCFVFRRETLAVVLGANMKTKAQVRPFPCTDIPQEFKGLSGPFFEYVKRIPALNESQCIWAGPDCTFNGMVDFVKSVPKAPNREKFIAGGQLFLLRARISNNTAPSASFFEGNMVIVGPIKRGRQKLTVREALEKIVGPFEPYAWIMLFMIIFLFVIARLCIALVFTWPFSWRYLISNLSVGLFPELDHSSYTRSPAEVQLRYLNGVWLNSAKVFFVVVALFYELAVVNFVLSSNLSAPTVVPRELSEAQLGKYAVVKDSAESVIFRNSVREEFRSPRRWSEVNSGKQLFDKIVDKRGSITHGVIFDISAQFEIFKRNLCDNLAVYMTEEPILRYSMVWYYGANVDLATRVNIDAGIASLRERNEVWPAIDERLKIADGTCGTGEAKIGALILLMPLAIFLGPFFSWILLYLGYVLLLRSCREV